MNHVGVYFDRVLLTALGSPKVKRVEQVRREHDATGRIGFMRYRLTLINDDLLELIERVEVQVGEIVVTKYRYHWQGFDGNTCYRWDNARHHANLASFPHHVHVGATEDVQESSPVDLWWVIGQIEKEL